MKKIIYTTIYILYVIHCVHAQIYSPIESDKIIATEKNRFEKKHNILKSSHAGNNINLTYMRVIWQIDPAVSFISGNLTYYFKTTLNTNIIEFDLSNALHVDSVKYHTQTIFHQQTSTDLLQINFPQTINAHTSDSITIYYKGAPPSSGFGSFAVGTHSGVPVQWTLSEPYGAKDWWPCKLSLTDKIDSIDIFIITPANYRAASNGILVSEVVSGSYTLCHWKHRYPIATYLVFVSVTNYAVFSDWVYFPGGDSLEILNYVFPEDSLLATTTLSKAVDVMLLFDSLFTPYPFINEKYGHAQFKWGGGMEHQTMSSMGGFHFELVAHELAHQWFGDKITCGSWADLWLNEGFATYLAGLCYENMFNGYYWPIWKKNQINSITDIPDGSVYVSDTNDINRLFNGRLTYAKAAYLLHMLRWTLGDANFFTAIKNYLNSNTLSYNYAKTNHLKWYLEQAYGYDLSEFFNDWFYGQGWPSYNIYWYQDDNNYISVKINQSTSHPSVNFFEMKLPVRLKNDIQQMDVVLQHDYNNQSYHFYVPFIVDSLIFDKELWILSANNKIHKQAIDEEFFEFNLYPNPTHDETELWIDIKSNKDIKITLTDVLGKTIYQTDILNLFPGSHRIPIQIKNMAKGSYFINIYSHNKKIQSLKLLKI